MYTGTDDRFCKLVFLHCTLVRNFHKAGECEPVHSGIKRTYTVAEFLREHRYYLVGNINACASFKSVIVKRRAFGDIVADIGDMNAELITAFCPFNAYRIVNILRICAVYGEYGQVTQVKPFSCLLFVNNGIYILLCLIECFLREIDRYIVLDKISLGGGFCVFA